MLSHAGGVALRAESASSHGPDRSSTTAQFGYVRSFADDRFPAVFMTGRTKGSTQRAFVALSASVIKGGGIFISLGDTPTLAQSQYPLKTSLPSSKVMALLGAAAAMSISRCSTGVSPCTSGA
jgi:hypothetical protein